jgi:succinate dehydrogenase/fumarate reductase cytochrome b subunit
VFVWLFHRISGLLLVVLLPLQLVTGLLQSGSQDPSTSQLMAALHGQGFLTALVAFLVIFHGLYGVRSLLLDLGVRREGQMFWICTAIGGLLFAAYLYLSMMTAVA